MRCLHCGAVALAPAACDLPSNGKAESAAITEVTRGVCPKCGEGVLSRGTVDSDSESVGLSGVGEEAAEDEALPSEFVAAIRRSLAELKEGWAVPYEFGMPMDQVPAPNASHAGSTGGACERSSLESTGGQAAASGAAGSESIQLATEPRSSLARDIQDAISDPRPSVPHEDVMARMEARIARLKAGKGHDVG